MLTDLLLRPHKVLHVSMLLNQLKYIYSYTKPPLKSSFFIKFYNLNRYTRLDHITTRWYLRVEYTIHISILLNTETRAASDTRWFTRYLGNVEPTFTFIWTSNPRQCLVNSLSESPRADIVCLLIASWAWGPCCCIIWRRERVAPPEAENLKALDSSVLLLAREADRWGGYVPTPP